MYESVAKAMTDSADQTVGLVKLTPHRVMRELYEQFIAYARAFADSIPTYTSKDSHLAGAVDSISSAPGDICGAVTYGPAASQGPLIPATATPSSSPQSETHRIPRNFSPPQIQCVQSGYRRTASSHRYGCLAGN